MAAHATPVRGAHGGTGVSRPGQLHLLLDLDLTATGDLRGLHAAGVELLDASGGTLARATPPIGLRRSLPGRDRDHNEITAPFDGAILAGTTVRLRASAEVAGTPAGVNQLRYRMTLRTDAVTAPLVVEGLLDAPWASAGPAAR